MTVSDERQRDSAAHGHVSLLPQPPSRPGCRIALSRVPCAGPEVLVIRFMCLLSMSFFKNSFCLFWGLRWVSIAGPGLSLIPVRGPALVGVHGLLVVASLVAEQRSGHVGSRAQAQQLWRSGLSCSEACGIYPDQGLNPCPLLWQMDSLPLIHQEDRVVCFDAVKHHKLSVNSGD